MTHRNMAAFFGATGACGWAARRVCCAFVGKKTLRETLVKKSSSMKVSRCCELWREEEP
jgi:hypothetical protein